MTYMLIQIRWLICRTLHYFASKNILGCFPSMLRVIVHLHHGVLKLLAESEQIIEPCTFQSLSCCFCQQSLLISLIVNVSLTCSLKKSTIFTVISCHPESPVKFTVNDGKTQLLNYCNIPILYKTFNWRWMLMVLPNHSQHLTQWTPTTLQLARIDSATSDIE